MGTSFLICAAQKWTNKFVRFIRLSKFCNFSKYEAVTDESIRDYLTFKDMLEEERDEGRAEGRVEGANAKAREMAKAMLAEGDSIDKVARCSGLSEEEIKSL